MRRQLRVNLGGEGEIPGVLNQNGPWIVEPGWVSSHKRLSLWELVSAGHQFLICENLNLPIPDDSVDVVITNSIPKVDRVTHLGPTVQTSEIRRILKAGGRWVHNGRRRYTKP
jgi:hypothetical protein